MAAQVTHRSGRQTEDMMVATGLLEGGIVVSHQVNWLTPFKERVTIVTGEKGAFVADTLTGDLTRRDFTVNAMALRLPDLELVDQVAGIAEVPLVVEGRVHTPAQAAAAMEHGAFAVVVGTAITHPTTITSWFASALPGALWKE